MLDNTTRYRNNRPAENYSRNYNNYSNYSSYNTTSEAIAITKPYKKRRAQKRISSTSKIPSRKPGVRINPMYTTALVAVFAVISIIYGVIVSETRTVGREVTQVKSEIKEANKQIDNLNSEKNKIAPIMSIEEKAISIGMTETNPPMITLEKIEKNNKE